MCEKTGKEMFNHLINLAKESHFNNHKTSADEDDCDSQEIPNDPQNALILNQVHECISDAVLKLQKEF